MALARNTDAQAPTATFLGTRVGFIEEATKAAKSVADVLVVSAFADVDSLYDKVARAGHIAPSVDAWTSQVYRGALATSLPT